MFVRIGVWLMRALEIAFSRAYRVRTCRHSQLDFDFERWVHKEGLNEMLRVRLSSCASLGKADFEKV